MMFKPATHTIPDAHHPRNKVERDLRARLHTHRDPATADALGDRVPPNKNDSLGEYAYPITRNQFIAGLERETPFQPPSRREGLRPFAPYNKPRIICRAGTVEELDLPAAAGRSSAVALRAMADKSTMPALQIAPLFGRGGSLRGFTINGESSLPARQINDVPAGTNSVGGYTIRINWRIK